jgi:hypothetical protein
MGGGKWCAGGRWSLRAAGGFGGSVGVGGIFNSVFFHFISSVFFSNDGILEERGTSMAG